MKKQHGETYNKQKQHKHRPKDKQEHQSHRQVLHITFN